MVGVVAWRKQSVKQRKVQQHVCHGDCIPVPSNYWGRLSGVAWLTDQWVSDETHEMSYNDIATVRPCGIYIAS